MRGSIFKRGKTWTAQVYLGRDPVTGKKRHRQLNGFATRKAAELALIRLLEEIRVGSYVEPTDVTVGEFLTDWLGTIAPTVRASTFASYSTVLKVSVLPRIGNEKLAGVTPLMLARLHSDLLAAGRADGNGGLSPRTVQYAHRVLGRAFKDAMRWGLLSRNPASQVTAPKPDGPERLTWSASEVRRFLRAVGDDRLFAMWVLLCTTGMRRGEVLGLHWRDIDLDGGRVSVQRQLVEVNYETSLVPPKTDKGRRPIALDKTTVAVLRQHRQRQSKERVEFAVVDVPTFVFTHADGRPLQPQNVSQSFERIARRQKLPAIRLHDLRHTAATLALEAGVHPKIVSERLGHVGIQITLDLYSHVVRGMQDEAAETMEGLIFGDDGDDGDPGPEEPESEAS